MTMLGRAGDPCVWLTPVRSSTQRAHPAQGVDRPDRRVRGRTVSPVSDDQPSSLLGRAARGDEQAWNGLVDQYSGLVWSVVRIFRFDHATTADVCQTVWLRLAEHAGTIRDPDRLGGWLAATARNECYRLVRGRRREVLDPLGDERGARPDQPVAPAVEERFLVAEEQAEVAAAFRELPHPCQELLRLLCLDPPLDYATVGRLIDRPVGSIGPTRHRCLDKLRLLLGAPDGQALT